ncbi:hypothetical protein SBRCBS47491_009577 [Sporothrix bragantina]|uniref:Uncharacterized protein n=1 Tax=Sporothrix bragantina TaxID=671064 RepID=A0ABP0CW20_9PEZI
MVLSRGEHIRVPAPAESITKLDASGQLATTTTTATIIDAYKLQDLKTYTHCHEVLLACTAVLSEIDEAAMPTTTIALHTRGPPGFADFGAGDFPDNDTNLYTISVYSEDNDPNVTFEDGRVPVWKWLKPASPYGPLQGFWETELAQALEDGAWRGGSELMLLVAGVSESTRGSIVGRKVTTLEMATRR